MKLTSLAKINFNAFTTPGYGVLAAAADVEGDGFTEIAAAKGHGPTHTSRFLGFDCDGVAIAALSGYDVTPVSTLYGGRVGLGNVDDADGTRSSEPLAGAGLDPTAPSTVEDEEDRTLALTAACPEREIRMSAVATRWTASTSLLVCIGVLRWCHLHHHQTSIRVRQ